MIKMVTPKIFAVNVPNRDTEYIGFCRAKNQKRYHSIQENTKVDAFNRARWLISEYNIVQFASKSISRGLANEYFYIPDSNGRTIRTIEQVYEEDVATQSTTQNNNTTDKKNGKYTTQSNNTILILGGAVVIGLLLMKKK